MSLAVGLLACAVSSLLFGSVFVPIKKFQAGNGIFVQWVMSTSILMVGLIVYSIQGFPKFEPLAMLGGAFWALGNATAVPIMNTIGIGMGMLIWGTTNCIAGWAAGRFGLFGIKPTTPSIPLLNYFGLLLVVLGGFLFSQIRSSSSSSPSVAVSIENEDSPLISSEEESTNVATTHRLERRLTAIAVSLLAGVFYGITFLPVIYVQDHPELYPDAPREGLSFVFSHFCGIFISATSLLLAHVIISKNAPFVNNAIIGPSILGGAMWGVAQSSWFVANDNLSQAVSFPIISMVPGVCAAVWGVFCFKEIEGSRNLRLLCIAVVTTLLGATLVGVSK